MDASKIRLRKMKLRNRTQFHILSHLVRLSKQQASIQDNDRAPTFILRKDEIKTIFHRSAKCVVSYLLEFEKLGYVKIVPLKPGGHSSKISEWAITVGGLADKAVHREISLENNIMKKQREIQMEREDFMY